MALSLGPSSPALGALDDRFLDYKRLTTIAEAQDERMQRETPRHPIRGLQGALEEALRENADPNHARWCRMPSERLDSASRRRMLLQQVEHEDPYPTRWRQRPGEAFHPLTKLVAQITFGIHLLHKRLVKSDDEIIQILQTYVGEVDAFLEHTTEDFDLALGDIDERIKCLRLPLEHDEIFDAMLEDRVFRKQIVDGNEKIEHIINRTEASMNDALDDVQQALDATKDLAKYLVRLDRRWARRTNQHEDVYAAMSGNSEGWFRCLFGLQTKGHSLSVLMLQLGSVVAELQRRAGIASRKNIAGLICAAEDVDEQSPISDARPTSPAVKRLPQNPHPITISRPSEQFAKMQFELRGIGMPSLESLSPPKSTVAPTITPTGGPESFHTDRRPASAQELRPSPPRASIPTQTTISRGGSLRETRRHREDCVCSCADGLHRQASLSSRRASIARAFSLRRKRQSIGDPAPLSGTTDETPTSNPQFTKGSSITPNPPAPDSAYSSGESVVQQPFSSSPSSSPEPDRVRSPAPTFTSDLYHSSVPSSSRLHQGKAAAIMGTLQCNASQRDGSGGNDSTAKFEPPPRPSTAPAQTSARATPSSRHRSGLGIWRRLKSRASRYALFRRRL